MKAQCLLGMTALLVVSALGISGRTPAVYGASPDKKICEKVMKHGHRVLSCHTVKPTTIYATNWQSGTTGWTSGGAGQWKVANGALQFDAKGDGTFVAPYRNNQSNYFVEASIQQLRINPPNPSKPLQDAFGILFRAPGAFDPSRDSDPPGNALGAGVSRLTYDGNDAGSEISVVTVVDYFGTYDGSKKFKPGNTIHLYRLEVRANTMWIYFDGHLAVVERNIHLFLNATRVGLFSIGDQIRVTSFRVGPLT